MPPSSPIQLSSSLVPTKKEKKKKEEKRKGVYFKKEKMLWKEAYDVEQKEPSKLQRAVSPAMVQEQSTVSEARDHVGSEPGPTQKHLGYLL